MDAVWGTVWPADSNINRFTIFTGIVHDGDEGARTPDLDSAIVALSQLSYIPRQPRS